MPDLAPEGLRDSISRALSRVGGHFDTWFRVVTGVTGATSGLRISVMLDGTIACPGWGCEGPPDESGGGAAGGLDAMKTGLGSGLSLGVAMRWALRHMVPRGGG